MSSGRRSFLLGLLILGATVCLVLGLTLPIMRLTKFYVWTDVHSLISVVRELYMAGEYVLAGIILLFSIIFPFLKLLYLLAQLSIGVEKIPTDGATASPAIAPTITTVSPAPNVSPPRPADAGSGTTPLICSGVSNVGPTAERHNVSLVRRGVNANQCMADENLTRLNRRDHAVVDAPLGSQRQAIQ